MRSETWTLATSLALQSLYLCVQLRALTSEEWIVVEADSSKLAFSLRVCENCPGDYDSYTPECILNIDCKVNPDAEICPIAKRLVYSRDLYLVCAIVCLFTSLLSSLSELYRFLGYPSSSRYLSNFLLLTQLCASLLSVLSWFIVTKASFHPGVVTASNGPVLAISAVVLATLGASGLCLVRSIGKKPRCDSASIGLHAVFGLKQRYWLCLQVYPLLLLSAALCGVSLSLPWVRYHTNATHTGTISTLDSLFSFKKIEYSCVAGPACRAGTRSVLDLRNCNAFPKLEAAATAYWWCEGASWVAMGMWLNGAVYYSCGVEYGIPTANYMWSILTVLLKLVGVIAWFLLSGASYTANCEVAAFSTNIDFCAVEGSALALWSLLSLCLAAVFYLILYRNRKRAVISSDSRSTISLEEAVKPGLFLQHPAEAKSQHPPAVTEASLSETVIETRNECVACGGVNVVNEVKFELPCRHWIHIECFERIGNNRKNCPECWSESQGKSVT